jgi:5-methylcytosine-specific restriction endonuclease McrA
LTSPAETVVSLVEAALRSLLGPGELPDRVPAARTQIEHIDTLGLRQALCDDRTAEQKAVVEWVAANRHRLPARSAMQVKRAPMSEATRVRTFRRDAFTCRYSRCRQGTLYLPVLRELATLFPNLLGTNANWRPLERHIVYWTCTSTLEHRVPLPYGGTESEDNYLTACSRCQYVKVDYPLADCVWHVDPTDAAIPGAVVEAERPRDGTG